MPLCSRVLPFLLDCPQKENHQVIEWAYARPTNSRSKYLWQAALSQPHLSVPVALSASQHLVLSVLMVCFLGVCVCVVLFCFVFFHFSHCGSCVPANTFCFISLLTKDLENFSKKYWPLRYPLCKVFALIFACLSKMLLPFSY